jgi:hypothetical protein
VDPDEKSVGVSELAAYVHTTAVIPNAKGGILSVPVDRTREDRMNRGKVAISAFAIGAAFMYFSDPNRGKRRRVLVRDKAAKTWHRVTGLADKAQRDLFNRAEGAFHEFASASKIAMPKIVCSLKECAHKSVVL